ncbi:right-handed parallel beta-helix repeat-containing protein [Altericroceibacterium spongiae]|uniref:Right-handed parallel beta-helix repeat-containing protein n=2 Tax=Altericroceibacterium spongiae TaxID=2320269 RepID=A0A420EQ12_9SPHN|nr:right-handed parallel beta-helix repeat-containing protein [Altericroceibacterium spongiae]
MKHLPGIALCLAAGLSLSGNAAWAQSGNAPFTLAGTGQHFPTLQAAVKAIGTGSGTISIAPGTYRECAVQEGGAISYLAEEPGTVIFDGVACEGKAALVLRGQSAEVSGLTFRNIEVRDYNGAGIRLEGGDLTVAESWFQNSQQGILSAGDPTGTIVIDRSTFTGLGTCAGPGGCAHSLYIGDYKLLRVTRSRFEKGRGGHYVKSRAGQVQIASCSFDDSQGRATNYMIDLPAGATGQISNNWFVQGRDKENHSALIAVAAENRHNSSAGLTIVGNDARLAPGVGWSTVFVANWSDDQLDMEGNALSNGIRPYEKR